LKQIETLFGVGTLIGLPDEALLDLFIGGSVEDSEAAFLAVVERHGPMVLQVCRQILGNSHDAEDASQATFLVLARKARTIRRMDSVASWLYGVASRIAARARVDAARRRRHERESMEKAMAMKLVDQGDRSETWPELYEELGRLPERLRLPIVLFHLEGLSYEQMARQFGCPVRTVQSRLARARERLRSRLARRGVGPAGILLAAALVPNAVSAAVSTAWKQSTVKAAVHYVAGGTSAAMVPAAVAALAQGALRAMILNRLKSAAMVAILVGVVAGGAGVLARPSPPNPLARGDQPVPEPRGDRYRVTMAGGATIEVVAVSRFPTGPKTWWQPDGTPLVEPFADPLPAQINAHEQEVRAIVVRVAGLAAEDTLKWLPTHDGSYWGGRPTKDDKKLPGMDVYVASFRRDRQTCAVEVRLAAGSWKTEASDPGHGGHGMVIDGHKYDFGKARAYQGGTSMAVAHNLVNMDIRLVAVDLQGKEHPANYSGGPGAILSVIDAEFHRLPPDQIREFRVQSRPFERAQIKDIALQPRPAGKSTTKAAAPSPAAGPPLASSEVDPNADTDGDGLSDYQEIHKYQTDPKKLSTADDGIPDGDWQRRREFTYTIRSVVKVMPPVNLECLSDDYQDARVLSRGSNFVELEVIHYPLNSNADAIRSNSDWRRDTQVMKDYLRPGTTTNWDAVMQRDLVAALKSAGIAPDQLDDRELVNQVSRWLFANSKFTNMFCTHYVHYPEGRAAIYPGIEAKFESDKGNHAWRTQEQLEHELFGRSMFAYRTHGSCTSSAIYLTTVLRAVGIPTRMVLGIPLVDANDSAQMAMVRDKITHHRVRCTLLLGLSSATGYANHTFNEVVVGGRWVRLNYTTLGQNSLDANTMGLLTHVNTFNDLSEVPLAATWGKRYALGERDAVFRYGNPYRCEEVSDHFGKYARVENPSIKEHRAITISRAYWADAADAPDMIKQAKPWSRDDGSGHLLIHGEEWFDDEPWQQLKIFLQAAGKEFLFKAAGHPEVRGQITTGSFTSRSQNLREMEILIPRDEYAKMEPRVEYTLTPRNEVAGYEWKTKRPVTITKPR